MGRRGRTGAGGAVVSSLSGNSGGTVAPKRKNGSRGGGGGGGGAADVDFGVDIVFETKASGKARAKKNAAANAAASAGPAGSSALARTNPVPEGESLSIPRASAGWLGKSPVEHLRDWCEKNNRKRPYFSTMHGRTRCNIPAGKRDGKRSKGSEFDAIVGVGDRPGDQYAALNVLHQVMRGRPLERLLAPEFRDFWLDLDRRFAEEEKNQSRKAFLAEKRKKSAASRARAEETRESATINISAASRQVIEDALLEHRVDGTKDLEPVSNFSGATSSRAVTDANMQSSPGLETELVRLGFAEPDAQDASRRFADVTQALDYLCLNLDESELPASFAPAADVEVVQFHRGEGKQPKGRVDMLQRDRLTDALCMSKYAAEKALKATDGDILKALKYLYSTLTHGFSDVEDYKWTEGERRLAEQERTQEAETIEAIYGEDSKVGFGIVPGFEDAWAAAVTLPNGAHGVGHRTPVVVICIDVDGCYPFSAPVVMVTTASAMSGNQRDVMQPAQRRVASRAAAGCISSLRRSACGIEGSRMPVHVVYDIVSFVSEASDREIMKAALSSRTSTTTDDRDDSRETKQSQSSLARTNTPASGGRSRGRNIRTDRRIDVPQPVHAPRQSAKLIAMTEKRKALPAHKSRDEILHLIKAHQVVVVSGATGSGKTTQVPQFLLEEAARTGEPLSIVCTQPRRIAAMSVAERVATERCERVGESVGFQVKLNSKRSRSTRLVFCTTGVLLRRLQTDPTLDALTHVVVDEVHERSVDTDFLLLLLREILTTRPSLRVVLMSATLDAVKFSDYYVPAVDQMNGIDGTVPIVNIPGRTFPVDEFYLEDVVALTQYRLRVGDRYARKGGRYGGKGKYGYPGSGSDPVGSNTQNSATLAAAADDPDPESASEDEDDGDDSGGKVPDSWDADDRDLVVDQEPQVQEGAGGGSNVAASSASLRHVRETAQLIDDALVNIDLIDMLVRKIDREAKDESRGAILVFLPGAAEISAVVQKLSGGPGSGRLLPLPLHSLLSPDEQALVFARPPKGKRKVICSTNIAETSITVEDVTVVIDTLRAKEMSYDSLNGSSVLAEDFISKAAALQRAGRAGRVSRGTCYRLVRKGTFDNRLAAQQTPEIQRVALEHLVLNLLSVAPDGQSRRDPHQFLAKAVDPPEPASITCAVANLVDIGALTRFAGAELSSSSNAVELTALGRHLTGLPVDARIGKLLVFGALFSCVDAALTIAATVAERSPFYAPRDKRDEARAARLPFVWGKSDLLTYVKAFNAWRDIRKGGGRYGAEQEFCSKNFLSRKTLLSIAVGRTQLANSLSDAGFGLAGYAGGRTERGWEQHESVNMNSANVRVLKAVTCAALYPNVARIDPPETTYREVMSGAIPNKFNSRDMKLRSKTGERLFLHPESVNFHEGDFESRWLAYFAKVKTTRLFLRDSTMVSPYAILLFGGNIEVQHERGQMSVDKWVVFKAPARVAVLVRELRRELDALLMRKFDNPGMNLNVEGRAVNDAIIRVIKMES